MTKPKAQQPTTAPTKRLTIKQKKFVAAKIAGKTNHAAYVEAGYSAPTLNTATSEGSKLHRKPSIQAAIDKALEFHEATPEFAVGRLKSIAAQDVEIGAARLASKDILELHGWRKDERPQVSLNIKQAFFTQSRTKAQEPIEGEIVQDSTL
jgi:phage terminase small subunit